MIISLNTIYVKDYFKKNYSVSVSGDYLLLNNAASETLTFELSEVKAYDEFKGVWTKTANVNKYYEFDGMGGWTYTQILYDRTYTTADKETLVKTTGTYTYDATEQILTLDNGVTASWKNGFLEINDNGETELYYAEESHVGTWSGGGIVVSLEGIGKNGYGNAIRSITITAGGLVAAGEVEEQLDMFADAAPTERQEGVESTLYELRRRDLHRGIITFCIGGGLGVAMLVER